MKIVYSRQARDDLAEIAAYLQSVNPAAAVKVGLAIEKTIGLIARYHLVGCLQQDNSRKFVVNIYKSLIVYDVGRKTVEITTIRHGARRRMTNDA